MDFNSDLSSDKFDVSGITNGNEACSITDGSDRSHWLGSQDSLDGAFGKSTGKGFLLDLGKQARIFGFLVKQDNQDNRSTSIE